MSFAGAYATGSTGPAATAELLRTYLLSQTPACSVRPADPEPAARVVPEGLVDIRREAPSIVILDAPVWSDPELRFMVRPEVAERLRQAAEALPSDMRLGFWEGLRPVAVQRTLWNSGLAFLRVSNPQASRPELEQMLEQYVARPDGSWPPHSTGSAVDVAALDVWGRVLSPQDAWGRLGLELLAGRLRETGLAAYEPEWWHWSYGDEEWARAYDCSPLAFATPPTLNSGGDGI